MDEGVVTAPPTAGEPQIRGSEAADYDIRLIGLTKRFDDVVAVDDVSLDIDRGQFFALLGPSGCGKTTTLRMIGGFEEPTQGRIELGGVDVAPLPPYKRDVNTVFQSYALFPHLSIFENVAFGLRRRGVKSGEVRRRVGEALELVGLAGLERRKPRQLSGGQQQRIALARALVNRPRVLLLDEPLGALDLKLRKEMQLELKRIQHEVEITFVHVTHDQEEAMTMADRIVIMNGGQIEQLGTPSELYERPRTAFVAGFLGASNLLEGTVAGDDRVKLTDGTLVQVPREALPNRTGSVQIGVRPEKLRIGGEEGNSLSGVVTESAYIGVSTQYIVDTPAGPVTVYVQNDRPGGQVAAGERLTLSWSPESTFVVDAQEGTQ
jgi:spermidine/putrescine transport system ATP-binding protein